jgi:starch synthase (maltosyl-transferring)
MPRLRARTRDPLTHRTEGRARVVIEGVDPEIDAGKFPAKAVAGDPFRVECDAFADGHDVLRCMLRWRTTDQRRWREVEMRPLGNDRWRAAFVPEQPGRCVYELEAWVDHYGGWLRDLHKRVDAGQDVQVDLEIGAALIDARAAKLARSTPSRDRRALHETAERLRRPAAPSELPDVLALLGGDVRALMNRHDPRTFVTRYPRELEVVVDRERAAFSAWYELFPRSTGKHGRHGTFATAADVLPYVAELGFDIVYLPPIHPIGVTSRKGKNNQVSAEPGDVGSPWAIGSELGGHTAVEPALGTLDDFQRFRAHAEGLGLEVALDVAFQTSPDHPWVREHPAWFKHRPDGSVQYAENPPKKYQDIYPLDFESDEWWELWQALRGVFEFWMEQGVRIFRVDNPHTKALPFWAWVIPELKRSDPGLVFLSEAFTRPKVMYHLAKLGFTQSYTYFAWRNHRWDLSAYLQELGTAPVRHYFRPNFWPNTPDILTETLQHGGRPAFMMRAVLAATLAANWGIYGPAFELLEHRPREEGSEEYLHSEKYELRCWDLNRPDSLRHVIARLNRVRREHPALQRDHTLRLHDTDNESLLCYSKRARHRREDGTPGDDVLLMVVNLDPWHRQAGWTRLDLEALGLAADEDFQVHDLLGGGWHQWHGARNYVELEPGVTPAHVLEVVRHPRTERDFEYFD